MSSFTVVTVKWYRALYNLPDNLLCKWSYHFYYYDYDYDYSYFVIHV